MASWVLAELIRFCSPNTNRDVATASIQELTAKIVPFFEVIEGRTYIHNGHELKAEEVALPLLYHAYPGRVAYDELVKAVKRHGIAQSSAYAGISKLKNFVDAMTTAGFYVEVAVKRRKCCLRSLRAKRRPRHNPTSRGSHSDSAGK